MLRGFTVTDNDKVLSFKGDGMKFDEALGVMIHHALNCAFKEVLIVNEPRTSEKRKRKIAKQHAKPKIDKT
jgi:hypothetical protein